MRIVTGHTGVEHITSNDDQAKNQGIFGTGNMVLNLGQKFALTINSAVAVTIEDGEGIMQGVHFRIETGTTEEVTLTAGVPNYNRIDLIVARYTKNAVTGVEDVSLAVIEGEPAAGTPTQPTYTQGDILSGDTLAEYPLYKITFTGVTPAAEKLFSLFKFNAAVDVGVTLGSTASGSAEVPYEAGIYAISGSVGVPDPVVQSGTQQSYEITAHAWDYSDTGRNCQIRMKDTSGQNNLYFNGIIVVDDAFPYIIFSASVGSASFANKEAWFNLNVTRIG